MIEYFFTGTSRYDGERVIGCVSARCYDEAIAILSQHYTDVELEIYM